MLKYSFSLITSLCAFITLAQNNQTVEVFDPRTDQEILEEFKENLFGETYTFTHPSDRGITVDLLRGDKYKFKRNGIVKAKIDRKRKKGKWIADLSWNLSLDFSDGLMIFQISSYSSKKVNGKITPHQIFGKYGDDGFVLTSKFNPRKRKRKLKYRRRKR